MPVHAKDLKRGSYLRYDGGAPSLSNLTRQLIPKGAILEVDCVNSGSTVTVRVYDDDVSNPFQLTNGGGLHYCTHVERVPMKLRGPSEWKVGDLAYITEVPRGVFMQKGDIVKVTEITRHSKTVLASNRRINGGGVGAVRVLTREEVCQLPNKATIMRIKRMGNAEAGSTLVKDTYTSPQQHGDLSWALVSLPPSPEEERKSKLLNDISEMEKKLAEMKKEAQGS